jgi:transcription antitermination protein NusB
MSERRTTRREARKRALDILYEADLLARPVATVLVEHLRGEDPPNEFSLAIIRGVDRNRAELDGLIESHAKDWRLSRMPVVDRNLLRIGLFEIIHDPEVPAPVAIDEAVGLAKELSTDDSGRFVNGVLARIADEHAKELAKVEETAEQRSAHGSEHDAGPDGTGTTGVSDGTGTVEVAEVAEVSEETKVADVAEVAEVQSGAASQD